MSRKTTLADILAAMSALPRDPLNIRVGAGIWDSLGKPKSDCYAVGMWWRLDKELQPEAFVLCGLDWKELK